MKKGNLTEKQRGAMHLYFELLGDALNSAGWDMKKTLKHDVEIPWTKEMVKEYLWRPIQVVMVDKESTTELDTSEPSIIYDALSRHIAAKFGVHVEWPTEEQVKQTIQANRRAGNVT